MSKTQLSALIAIPTLARLGCADLGPGEAQSPEQVELAGIREISTDAATRDASLNVHITWGSAMFTKPVSYTWVATLHLEGAQGRISDRLDWDGTDRLTERASNISVRSQTNGDLDGLTLNVMPDGTRSPADASLCFDHSSGSHCFTMGERGLP